MTQRILNNNDTDQSHAYVHDIIRKFTMLGKVDDSSSTPPMTIKHNIQSASTLSSTISQYISNKNETLVSSQTSEVTAVTPTEILNDSCLSIKRKASEHDLSSFYISPTIIYKEIQTSVTDKPLNLQADDINLKTNADTRIDQRDTSQCASSIIGDYEINDIQEQPEDEYYIPHRRPPPPPPVIELPIHVQQESTYRRERTLPLSNFLLEIGILLVIFILCMILVSALRDDQENLHILLQVVFTYIYLVSIAWMIWCTFDIVKFRQQWINLTSSAQDQEEYMDIVARYPSRISYFPDMRNTSGLFMRIGAGLLCMGSLIFNVIQLTKIIEIIRNNSQYDELLLIHYSQMVFITKLINLIFRFIFHCVQFLFLFRYGNIVIDRHHLMARIGLIHIIIANFCTWFEGIVLETLDELRKHSNNINLKKAAISLSTTKIMKTMIPKSGERISISCISFGMLNCFKKSSPVAAISIIPSSVANSHNTTSRNLEFIENIESSMNVYLYPCFIEYSLICVTVFYIMWRNVGKKENQSFLHFGDRHVFIVDCSRASRGLFLGGIIFILAILTLIPFYILDSSLRIQITHITELILLIVSLLVVSVSFYYTSKLYYDRQAHVDIFDQILILVTTVGDFTYSFFGLFASIFIESYTIQLPRFVEISTCFLSIIQAFLQSAFILDALKRRLITRNDFRKKPGREFITALLLINLAIWMHDSLSAKKINLNPIQNQYYNIKTWSIVQAFTSPLSIFYRFHSSVCLADIWQEVYHDHKSRYFESKSQHDPRINVNDIFMLQKKIII